MEFERDGEQNQPPTLLWSLIHDRWASWAKKPEASPLSVVYKGGIDMEGKTSFK